MRPAMAWLSVLTEIPTTSGREHAVVAWVERWARRRKDIRFERDTWGNLLLRSIHPAERQVIVANAHMDHPGFVVTAATSTRVMAEFRGGVREAYFPGARVEFFDRTGLAHPGRVEGYESKDSIAIRLSRRADLSPGDIGRWRFPVGSLGRAGDRYRGHACDDLAGVAAALAVLDHTRRQPELGHFAVLLTRAEEEGFIGAIAAARAGYLDAETRILSIEMSRTFPDSPIGGGPIVRVGDFSSVFDADLTNELTDLARGRDMVHQRRLMAGGSCEATAFGAYGYRATGLCLAMGNYHNMAGLDEVERGVLSGRTGPEEISIADFDGLMALMLLTATHLGSGPSSLRQRLDDLFRDGQHLLG